MTQREELTTKICLVGDSSVGKTSLIRRYVFDEFSDAYLSTLGTKVTKRELLTPFPDFDLEVEVKLLIYDIIGEIGFRQLLRNAYFQGANGLMAVFDITREETLESIDDWVDNAYGITGSIPTHLLANKIDLKDEAIVTESEVRRISKDLDSPFEFTSAKTGENVEKVFEIIATRLVNRAVSSKYGDKMD